MDLNNLNFVPNFEILKNEILITYINLEVSTLEWKFLNSFENIKSIIGIIIKLKGGAEEAVLIQGP